MLKKKIKPLTIFGQVVPVFIVPLEKAGGYYYPTEKKIEIDSSLPDQDFPRALLHEIFHATFDRVSFSQAIPSELEEVLVDTLSKVVVENFTLKQKTIAGTQAHPPKENPL